MRERERESERERERTRMRMKKGDCEQKRRVRNTERTQACVMK